MDQVRALVQELEALGHLLQSLLHLELVQLHVAPPCPPAPRVRLLGQQRPQRARHRLRRKL